MLPAAAAVASPWCSSCSPSIHRRHRGPHYRWQRPHATPAEAALRHTSSGIRSRGQPHLETVIPPDLDFTDGGALISILPLHPRWPIEGSVGGTSSIYRRMRTGVDGRSIWWWCPLPAGRRLSSVSLCLSSLVAMPCDGWPPVSVRIRDGAPFTL